MTRMEHDEYADLCVFTFEVEEDEAVLIDRQWDDTSFAGDILEEAI